MIPVWMQHVELVVLAAIIAYSVSSFIGAVINCSVQKWMMKNDCTTCPTAKSIPNILHNQSTLREKTLPDLMVDIAEIKGDIKTIVTLLKQAKIHYEEVENL
jgi:hypothetical protein